MDKSLNDIEYDKAIGQFGFALNEALGAFDMYGLGIHITPAKAAITKLAMQLHHRLSGLDVPIGVNADYGFTEGE